MKYIKFKKENRYIYTEWHGREMLLLGRFLTSDLYEIDFWIEWANNPKYSETESNISWMEKKDNVLYIGFLFDEEKDYENAFKISKPEFINLIKKYDQLRNENYKEILITYKNGKVHLEGINDIQ